MAVFRVEGTRHPFDRTQVMFVAAHDAEQARSAAARLGSTANSVREVSADEVPPDSELIRAPHRDAPAPRDPAPPFQLADSALFRQPIRTIALGIGIGILGAWIAITVISWVLAGAFGIAMNALTT